MSQRGSPRGRLVPVSWDVRTAQGVLIPAPPAVRPGRWREQGCASGEPPGSCHTLSGLRDREGGPSRRLPVRNFPGPPRRWH